MFHCQTVVRFGLLNVFSWILKIGGLIMEVKILTLRLSDRKLKMLWFTRQDWIFSPKWENFFKLINKDLGLACKLKLWRSHLNSFFDEIENSIIILIHITITQLVSYRDIWETFLRKFVFQGTDNLLHWYYLFICLHTTFCMLWPVREINESHHLGNASDAL